MGGRPRLRGHAGELPRHGLLNAAHIRPQILPWRLHLHPQSFHEGPMAHPESEQHTPVGQFINGHCGSRSQDGVAQPDIGDTGADLDAVGAQRYRLRTRQGIVDQLGKDHGIKALLLRQLA